MQEKNVKAFFQIIPRYYRFTHRLLFIWHNHCSGNQVLQVKGVDSILLMSLEYPSHASTLKALDTVQHFKKEEN